ncbi:hypothetical protein B0H12DRAFT_1086667 [Mycena haematopus]|nr:hypothetical protein B0H12DRAFT_1086667 [Mycena haematopus]
MLVTFCLWLWPLLGLPLTYAATSYVISSLDTSLVYFSPGWRQEFSDSTQDSYMQADAFEAYLSVTLPSNAVSVSYVGFKRAAGSMYGYSLDCDTDCLLQTANGSDPTVTDDANAPQSTLFTMALDSSTQHTLYVYNIPSDQVDGSSQINFNNLNVALADVSSPIQPASDTVDQPPPTSSAGPTSVSVQTPSSTTPTSSSSSAGATLGSSNSVSATPTSAVPSGGATSTGSTVTAPSSVTGSQTPSVPVLPIASFSSTPGDGTGNAAGSSNSSGKVGSSPKTVAIGVTILAVVFGVSAIVVLAVFIRQRRRKRRDSYPGSSSDSLSSRGSIIPIMPPPPMRQASEAYSIPNPFIDPPSDPPSEAPSLDNPYSSSLMQRRMEGRTTPGSPAPNIPLPDIPQGATDSRGAGPATASYARNDFWITRSPAKPSFSSLV